jgi:hypothetical protein
MKKLYVYATGLTMVIALLCGCENKEKGKAETGAGKVIEPSMIISKEDAKAITGVDFGAGVVKEQPEVGLKLCVYDKGEAFLQVGITQMAFMGEMTRKSGNTPESIYKTTKSVFKDATSIDGVGDDNFLAPPGLHILKGGYYLTISLGRSHDKEKLKAAGMRAVDNLKKNAGT